MIISTLFNKLRPSGIRSQLILGIASIHVLLMSLFVADLANRQEVFFLKLNHDRAKNLAVNLANIATSHVISSEFDGLQKLLSTYKPMPGLEYAMIISDRGIVLAHTDPKYLGLKPSDSISSSLKSINETQTLVENDYLLDIASPITNHNEIVGWARICLSQSYVEPNLKEIRKRGLIYILISLLVGSIFAVVVARQLTKGLDKLVNAAEKIKDGNRDLRVPSAKTLEISKLVIAFNQMLDDISSNERLLSIVLENMPIGVWILDDKGKIISANSAGKEIWKGVEYVGVKDYGIYKGWFTDTGKEMQSHEWAAAIALSENRAVLNQEIEIECFDKAHKIILNSALPLRDDDGKIIGVIAINVDITDQKNTENTLRKTNYDMGERVKELKCLYRMSQLSNDPEKTITDILQDCADIIPPSYQHPEIACARIEFEGVYFESGKFVETEWKQEENITSKGETIGKVVVCYKEQMPEETEGPFLKEERFLINSIADMLGSAAERKKSAEILSGQNIELRKINAELDRFVYSVSHDLRAPLSSIMGLIMLLNDDAETGNTLQIERIEMMKKSVVRLENFIEDILNYSRNARTDITRDEIVFEDIIQEVKGNHKFMNDTARLDMEIKIDLHNKFISDKGRITVILNNLISNAVKYQDLTKPHSFVRVSVTSDEEKAIIAVEDNGIGIDPKDQEKIFEMFYRGSKQSTGTGLGLYIVKETVERLDATIIVASEKSSGSKFTVTVPNLLKHEG